MSWLPRLRSPRWIVSAALTLLLVPALALAAGNGKLQIHHIDVGQGDAILIISPLGETALVDDGNYSDCSGVKAYLQALGLASIKYHFASHYHSDHIGCIDDLAAIGITIGTAGYDRGSTYSSGVYTAYVNTLGSKRATMTKNQSILLDSGATYPVTIKCVDLNGAGVSTTDENALSLVLKVSYGAFDEALGGDLNNAVEPTVGPEMGDVEVYKVHHHGSATSTTAGWLTATKPEVGIISVGNGNSYNHPTSTALTNLHNAGVHTYWTETGNGVAPNATWDKVGGTIVVQAQPGTAASYTVAGSGFTHTYYNGGAPPTVHADQVASAITLLKGSISTGDVSRLAANDASRVSISAGVESGAYVTDWYGSVTLAHPPLNLSITYDGNFTISRTQYLYIYNFSTSAWTQINSGTVSTSDVTKTWSTTSPSAYVSSTREVRLRVRGSTNSSSSYTCRGDYMSFGYDYTQGTGAMVAQALEPAPAPEPVASDDIALAAAPNPAQGATRLSFTLSRDSDVRLEVYDLAGRRVAEPYVGRAPAGTTAVQWSFSAAGGSPLPSGVYFARLAAQGRSTVLRVVALTR
jgi:beta-lactamase superfamily II metal-dependent hydrolase